MMSIYNDTRLIYVYIYRLYVILYVSYTVDASSMEDYLFVSCVICAIRLRQLFYISRKLGAPRWSFPCLAVLGVDFGFSIDYFTSRGRGPLSVKKSIT